MKNNEMPPVKTLDDIIKEVRRSKKTGRRWPVHPAAQAGVVVGKAGELMQAVLTVKYPGKGATGTRTEKTDQARKIAIQTAAACLRFLEQFK